MTVAADVVSAFEDLGIDLDDPKVIDRFCALCDIYTTDVEKLSTEVMTFMFKKKLPPGTEPDLDILGNFEGEVLKKKVKN